MFTNLEDIQFDRDAVVVPVVELHLDEGAQKRFLTKKVEVVERQQEKRKKKKNKGVKDFMEGES